MGILWLVFWSRSNVWSYLYCAWVEQMLGWSHRSTVRWGLQSQLQAWAWAYTLYEDVTEHLSSWAVKQESFIASFDRIKNKHTCCERRTHAHVHTCLWVCQKVRPGFEQPVCGTAAETQPVMTAGSPAQSAQEHTYIKYIKIYSFVTYAHPRLWSHWATTTTLIKK